MKLIKLLISLANFYQAKQMKLDDMLTRWSIKLDKFIAKLASKKILANTKYYHKLTEEQGRIAEQNKELEKIVKAKEW